ncbi:Sporozoite surface protein [Trichinella pseudospiralis]
MIMKITVFQFVLCAFIQLAFSEKVLIYLNSTDSLSVVERKALNLAQIFYNLTQALPFYLLASDSLRDCIVLCCNEGTCKSVIYSNRESRCLLLQNSFNDHQSKLFRLKNRPQLYAVHTCNQSASAIPDVTRTVQEEELFLLPSYDYLPSSSEEEAANISEYPSESEASEILTEDVQRNETCYVAQSGAESEELTDDSDNLIAERSVAIYQLLEECHVNFLLKGEVVVGYKVILQYSNVEHLQLCVYYCRTIWNDEHCVAVSFLTSERECTLYKHTDDVRVKINLKKNENFLEIVACYDDRSNERLENAPPLRNRYRSLK